MYTETKSQPDLESPRPSDKLIKKSAILCYDFLIFSQFMSKFTQTEKIITSNGWLFNLFAGGTLRSQIWLRFCLSVHTLALILAAMKPEFDCIMVFVWLYLLCIVMSEFDTKPTLIVIKWNCFKLLCIFMMLWQLYLWTHF